MAIGCSQDSALDGACGADGGCPAGTRCVVGTGVCERFLTPLDVDAAADAPLDGAAADAPPDGAADIAPADGRSID
jgi:hypothetical protein